MMLLVYRTFFLTHDDHLLHNASTSVARRCSDRHQLGMSDFLRRNPHWETEPVSITADEALQADCPPERTSALDEAKDWLQCSLASGPLTSEDVFDRAKADGVSEKTLQRASKALKVQKQKLGMGGPWSWSLPPKMAKSSEDAQVSDVATFDELGHLRDTDTTATIQHGEQFKEGTQP